MNLNVSKINRLLSAKDILSSKGYAIHSELLKQALTNYAKTLDMTYDEFVSLYDIKEISLNEYYKSSKVYIYRKQRPFSANVVDLEEYWPTYYFNQADNNMQVLTDDEKNGEFRIIYVDFVRGYIKLFNKYTSTTKIEDLSNYYKYKFLDDEY